jgi:hypothetical protein
VTGNGKTWEKLSNNGDIAAYNYCRCIDDLSPNEKRGLMLISGNNDKRMNKDSDILMVT